MVLSFHWVPYAQLTMLFDILSHYAMLVEELPFFKAPFPLSVTEILITSLNTRTTSIQDASLKYCKRKKLMLMITNQKIICPFVMSPFWRFTTDIAFMYHMKVKVGTSGATCPHSLIHQPCAMQSYPTLIMVCRIR